MNILITSIGKRKYLIDHFREALGNKGQVFAADASKFAPSLCFGDKSFVIPRADSKDYLSALLEISLKYRIGGILSINDRELPYLAAIKDDLSDYGVKALVSDSSVIDICFDKYKTYLFLKEKGIPVPKTYLSTEIDSILSDLETGCIDFPIIAKPRKGSRSVDIHIIRNKDTLVNKMNQISSDKIDDTEKHIFQQYIDSEQYSVHVLNDYSLKPIAVVGMVNILRHMDGETFEIKSLKDSNLLELGMKLGNSVKHLGSMSADVHKIDDTFVVLELNPRISGCYSLSHFANKNYTNNIISILEGRDITNGIFDFEENLVMLKQFAVTFDYESSIDHKVISVEGNYHDNAS